jgi:hypothetical protein
MLFLCVPASAIAASPNATAPPPNGGGFVTGASLPSGNGAPVLSPGASPFNAATGRCNDWFDQAVSNVYFHTVGYRLYWDFYLTTAAQGDLGSPVEVTMPQAQVNGRAIQPPYSPHTEASSYDFHSSIQNYNFLGGGSSAIKEGDKLWMFWDIYSLDGSGNAAWRSISCTVI